MKRILTLNLGALLGLALAACADGPPPSPDEARVAPPRHPRYPNVFISPSGEPFRAPADAPYPVAVWFGAADVNHDGRLTKEEFRADALRFFRKIDTNHDGVIDGAEVSDYEQSIAPEILPRIERLHAEEGMDQSLDLDANGNRDHPRAERRSSGLAQNGPQRSANIEPTQGAALFSLLNEPEPVAAADTVFDGRITQAEFLAAADRRFDRLDSRQQGYLLLSELPKTPVQQAIERAARKRPTQHRAPQPISGG